MRTVGGDREIVLEPLSRDAFMKIATVDDYSFRVPLLIHEEGLSEVPLDGWHSGEAWIETLSTARITSPIKALVLPLELKTASGRYSTLFGVELLSWLRWCGRDSIRWLPVIAVSWQSLTAVLREKPNLLLVCPGTQFHEITDVLAHDRRLLQLAIAAAQRGKLARCDQSALRCYTMGTAVEAAQVTYHDLANDHYAAYRLWVGYLHALEKSLAASRLKPEIRQALRKELDRAGKTPVPSVDEIERKQHTPSFQHFKLVRSVAQIPAYPQMEGAETIFPQHILNGLPPKTRVLLVDDEFDKGVASVLLQVLFRQADFTVQSTEQAIYKEYLKDSAKARFVCVKTAEAARNWLRYWGELPFSDDAIEAIAHRLSSKECASNPESGSFKTWILETYRMLGGSEQSFDQAMRRKDSAEKSKYDDPESEFRYFAASLLDALDNPDASPKKMTTVMILDLRLEKGTVPELYNAEFFSSTALRREVKHAQPQLPILMFTASRQAMNYVTIMDEARNVDGWLCKEAPDSPEDIENSTNSLLYLISKIHRFSTMGEWWHRGLGWDSSDEQEYGDFYAGPQFNDSVDHINKEATRILELIHQDTFSKITPDKGLLRRLSQTLFQPLHHRIELLLVARRLIIGTLLMTSESGGQSLSWDAVEFVGRLRGIKYIEPLLECGESVRVSKFGNQREFWFPSLTPERVMKVLLEDELLWLQLQDWRNLAPANASLIRSQIQSALSDLKTAATPQ
jgi:hypothetical protein